jgi:hypothetical protein
MSEITIKEYDTEVTEWIKNIRFDYEGAEYLVALSWSACTGYDITFKNKTDKGTTDSTPRWAQRWIDEGDMTDNLYFILDELTESEEG